jgi:hypothetical protein
VLGAHVFKAMEQKNLELLKKTEKSQDLVKGVYGSEDPQISL